MKAKIGDIIEVNTGHMGLILDMEMFYPGRPCSPVRNYIVMWNAEIPRHAFSFRLGNITKVDAFTIKRKVT